MMNCKEFMALVLSLNGVREKTHFDRIGFHIEGRRMFATYLAKDNTANIFLSPEEQAVFCKMDKLHIYPVPNKWGEKGATTFVLDQLPKGIVLEALISAYDQTLIHP